MTDEFLIVARKRAEAAVRDMAEGPLKVAAFQTILAQLIQTVPPSGTASAPSSGPMKAKRAQLGSGTTDRLLGLVAEGFFASQRSLADIKQMLSERGWHYQLVDLGTPVTRLVRRRYLRRTQVTERGKKIWKYSNY